MGNFYYGVLNTGRRRYAHPALSGLLPQPWLPAKAKPRAFGDGAAERRGVVLSLRRKAGKNSVRSRSHSESREGVSDDLAIPEGWTTGSGAGPSESPRKSPANGDNQNTLAGSTLSTSSNPWNDLTPVPSPGVRGFKRQISSPGRIELPDEDEENVWGEEAEDSSDEHEQGPLESPVCRIIPDVDGD